MANTIVDPQLLSGTPVRAVPLTARDLIDRSGATGAKREALTRCLNTDKFALDWDKGNNADAYVRQPPRDQHTDGAGFNYDAGDVNNAGEHFGAYNYVVSRKDFIIEVYGEDGIVGTHKWGFGWSNVKRTSRAGVNVGRNETGPTAYMSRWVAGKFFGPYGITGDLGTIPDVP